MIILQYQLLDSSVGGDTRVRTFTHQDTCDTHLERVTARMTLSC